MYDLRMRKRLAMRLQSYRHTPLWLVSKEWGEVVSLRLMCYSASPQLTVLDTQPQDPYLSLVSSRLKLVRHSAKLR